MVWLSTKNVKTKRLLKKLKKLDHKMISFYKIKELVRLSYQLDLLTSMKIQNVFHSNLLQLVANDLLPGQHNISPPLIVINDKEE